MLGWLSQWKDWRVEAEEYIPAGEFVVVMCRYTGRGKESAAAVDTTGAHLWTMRGGKPVRLEVLSSRTKALEAAGWRNGLIEPINIRERTSRPRTSSRGRSVRPVSPCTGNGLLERSPVRRVMPSTAGFAPFVSYAFAAASGGLVATPS
jgi:hypothetical protein